MAAQLEPDALALLKRVVSTAEGTAQSTDGTAGGEMGEKKSKKVAHGAKPCKRDRPPIQKLGNSEDASVYHAAFLWTDTWCLVNKWGFHERDLCITGTVAQLFSLYNLNELDHFLNRAEAHTRHTQCLCGFSASWDLLDNRMQLSYFSTCAGSLWNLFLQDGPLFLIVILTVCYLFDTVWWMIPPSEREILGFNCNEGNLTNVVQVSIPFIK